MAPVGTHFLSLEFALTLTTRLAGVAVAISSAELLWRRAHLEEGGLLDWGPRRRSPRRGDFELRALLLSARPFVWVMALRLSSACVLVIMPNPAVLRVICVAVVVVSTLLFHFRNPYGLDGADQMALVVFGALLLAEVGQRGQLATRAAVWFIGLQACLAYATAGIAKLVSREWRSGSAIAAVLTTETYGFPAIRALLSRPVVTRFAAWSVITFECLFPIAVLAGGVVVVGVIGFGILFHAATAVTMGLNNFFWAFVATYPAVSVISSQM